jgi:hypothetical protein
VIPFRPKAPEDSLPLPFHFARELRDGEFILSAAAAAVPYGLAVGTMRQLGGLVLVRVSGGTPGTQYRVTCAVGTTQGRTLAATGVLLVGQPGLDDPLYEPPSPCATAPVPGLVVPSLPVLTLASSMQGLAVAVGCMGTAVVAVQRPKVAPIGTVDVDIAIRTGPPDLAAPARLSHRR